MNPVYNEYIKFLRDTSGKELSDLKEGYFWLDKSIIKGFDKQGKEHKFYRIKISDDLEAVQVLILKNYDSISNIDLASWEDLIALNKERLTQLESNSLDLIKEKQKNTTCTHQLFQYLWERILWLHAI